MGKIRMLNSRGDVATAWAPTDTEATAAAKELFDEKVGGGYLAYTTTIEEGTRKGDVIKEFDPLADTIVLTPPMIGG